MSLAGSDGRIRGLVGGDPFREGLVRKGPNLEHPLFLDPVGKAYDGEQLRSFCQDPTYVEVGFGKGRFIVEWAASAPHTRIVGFEVRKGLVMATLSRLESRGLSNARLLYGDYRALLPRFVAEASLSGVFFLFPDPWWKKKHHKKRVWAETWTGTLAPHLKVGATVMVRSDVPMVLEMADETAKASPGFVALESAPYPTPQSDRERTCRTLGTPVDERWYRWMGLGLEG